MKTFSEIDEGNGVVMTYWESIRERVAKVEPKFAEIVDRLSPGKGFPLFLVYLPYGALKGDTTSSFLPSMDGSFYRLSDPDAPMEIIKNLGYGNNSSPLGMVLDKKLEYFIDLKLDGITLPCKVYGPGTIFPFGRILSERPRKAFTPNGVLCASSGSRSVFMLPQIGCANNHARLKSEFNVMSPTPRRLYDHCKVFSEIVNSEIVGSKWRTCLMYFSEEWINKTRSDIGWIELKTYLLEKWWEQFDYERASALYYDIIFSTIQNDRNLKPNPYIADTARHILTMALGEAPGYVPLCDEESLPLMEIQQIFSESYGLKKYHPTVIGPSYFNVEPPCSPIYYSLQYPSTHAFSPKSRTMSSILFEMKELVHVIRVFSEELSKDTSMCYGTALGKLSSNVDFSFYHSKADGKGGINNSNLMLKSDSRFLNATSSSILENASFSSDGKFLRGCVKISHNETADSKDGLHLE